MSEIQRQCQVQVTDPVQVSEDESDGWEDDESDCEWLYDQELQINSSAFTKLIKCFHRQLLPQTRFLESFLEYVHSFRYQALRPTFTGPVFLRGSSGVLG